jgi:predicted DNA-binding transcriptional regulator AlpA
MTRASQDDKGRGLLGPHELAALLGVSRQRAYQLAARPDFPAPAATLAIGRVWLLADVIAWGRARGRDL